MNTLNVISGMALVKVAVFGKAQNRDGSVNKVSLDVNGFPPVILVPIAGKIPNRFVLTGTVADRQGFEVGKTYLVKYVESGNDDRFGIQFNWTNLGEISDPMKMIEVEEKLGASQVIPIASQLTAEEAAASGEYEGRKTQLRDGRRTADPHFTPTNSGSKRVAEIKQEEQNLPKPNREERRKTAELGNPQV